MSKPIFRATAFLAVLLTSCMLANGQSYNVNLNSANNYATPGDSIEFELTITSAFSSGNFFQFGLAPLGIQSVSQVLPCSTASVAAYSATGSYTNYLIPSASLAYGSYIVLAQAYFPAIVDTVGYITLGPEIVPSAFQESIIAPTDFCFGDKVELTIDSIPKDSSYVDVPSGFPSGNVFWLPFSNSIQEYQTLQNPQQIGLGYALQQNRDALDNSSYYINSTNSALVYNQSPRTAAMSSYQGLADSSEFTMSFWVKRDSCTTGILFGRLDSTGAGSFACYLTDSCTIGFVGAFVNQSFQISTKQLEASLNANWNHVIIQKVQNTISMEINGSQADSELVLGALNTPQPLGILVGAPMSLLADTIPVPGAFAALDDIGFWSRALNSSEKADLRTAETYDMTSLSAYSWSTGTLDSVCSFSIYSDTLIKLNVINNQGVSHTDSVIILVNHPQILGINGNCLGDTTQLSAQNLGFASNYNYTWSSGDSTALHEKVYSSNQNVWVKSTGASSVCYDTLGISIYPLPTASISQSMPFNNTQTQVLLSTGPPAAGTQISWSTGDSTADITVYPSQTTAYIASGITTYGCTSTDTVIVEVENKTFIANLNGQIVTNKVHIAGNFNGWDPSDKSLANAGNGLYMATIPLVKGDTIAYKFINGDSWTDPHDSVSCSLLPIQSMGNRYAVLESNIDTIGPVMLSSCSNSPVMELIQADTASACFGDSLSYVLSSDLDSVFWFTSSGVTSQISTPTYKFTVPAGYSGALGVHAYYPHGVRLVDTIWVNQDAAIDTSITVTGATEFCAGDSVSLSVNSSYQVLWNNQQATPSVTVGQSSSFYATLTSLLGCSAITDTIDIVANANPDATLTVSSDTICSGDTSFVSAAPGYTYDWSNQASGSQISVTSSALIFVIVTDSVTNCYTQSDLISITAFARPAEPLFTGDTISMVGNKNGYLIGNIDSTLNYNWMLDALGTIYTSNSDSSLIKIEWTNAGTANLTATVKNGYCNNTFTKAIQINPLNIEERANSFIIYPNPSSGMISIEATANYINDEFVMLYDNYGALLKEIHLESTTNSFLDLELLPPGMYHLVFDDGSTLPFIIVK